MDKKKSSESESDQIVNLLSGDDQQYASEWLKQGVLWESVGVYARAAELIALNPGEIHLDLGTGSSPLLEELKKKCPEAILLGVDRNAYQLKEQVGRLHRGGFGPNLFVNTSFEVNKTRRSIIILFEPNAEIHMLHPLDNGKITLVADDFRFMQVVEQILQDRRIDSASMLLSGVSTTPIYEYPLPQKENPMDQQEVRKRTRRFCTESQQAALLWLTQRMYSGGNLILAERVAVRDGCQREDAVHDVLREMISPKLGDYWDLGKLTILDCDFSTQGCGPFHMTRENGVLIGSPVSKPEDDTLVLTSMPEASQMGFTPNASVTVFVQQLRRNNLIFVPQGTSEKHL